MSGVALNLGSLSRYGGRINSLSRTIISAAVQAAWSPDTAWFSASEQGLWYDPTDLTRYMSVEGSPELVTNGNFSGGTTTGWTASGSTLSVVSGALRLTSTGSPAFVHQSFTTEVGKTYRLRANWLGSGTSQWRFLVGTAASGSQNYSGSGVTQADAFDVTFVASATTTFVTFRSVTITVGDTVDVDNISVREIPLIATTTMYQDSAGTTPVTAVEQPVGLILDRRLGAMGALGADRVTDRLPRNANSTQVSKDATTIVVTSAAAGTYGVNTTGTNGVVGKSHVVTCTATSSVTRLFTFVQGGSATNVTLSAGVATTVRLILANNTATTVLDINGAAAGAGETLTISNLVVREVPGNHATQATSTARPTLRNRYNLLTFSEQFENAAWGITGVTRAANQSTAPDGTLSADRITGSSGSNAVIFFNSGNVMAAGNAVASVHLKAGTAAFAVVSIWGGSGTNGANVWVNVATGAVASSSVTAGYTVVSATSVDLGGGWFRVILTATVPAATVYLSVRMVDGDAAFNYTNTVGDTLDIWGAQLVTAADASLPYQRIAAATDYDSDASKFPLYLAFDGSDDSLATGSVDFSGKDKMTVVAGLTKLSDAAIGAVVGLSASPAGTAGAFEMLAPSTNGATDYRWTTRGSAVATIAPSGYPSPIKRVVAGLADIGADSAILRANGVQIDIGTGDQGTGNYSNNPIFIGRRGGTSLPLNGRLHQLLIRGAASADIAQAESFTATKTGVTI